MSIRKRTSLTPQENRVVELLWDGHGNESMAAQLGCSYDTVKRHLSNICAKTRTNTRLDLAMKTFKEAHHWNKKGTAE